MIYREDLAQIHHAGFSEFAESAAPGLLEILWRGGVSSGLVVDAGCGSGVWARELSRAGFDVFGFDASPAMIQLARQTAPNVRFEIASFDNGTLPRCDAVTAIGEVLNYGGDLEDFFRRAHAALRPSGMLVFDLAEPSGVHAGDLRVDGEDWVVITHKSVDGDTLARRITTYREGRKSEETHILKLYAVDTVKKLLKDVGFKVRVGRSYGTRRLPPAHSVFIASKLL
jgi:SAM-dependent methyltransferase